MHELYEGTDLLGATPGLAMVRPPLLEVGEITIVGGIEAIVNTTTPSMGSGWSTEASWRCSPGINHDEGDVPEAKAPH